MNTRRYRAAILTLAGLALASSALAQYSSPSPNPSAPRAGSTTDSPSGTTDTRSSTSTGNSYSLRDAEIIAVQGNEVLIKSTEVIDNSPSRRTIGS